MLFKAFTTLCVATVALAQSGLTINTPDSFIQCQPVSLTWSGGSSPYILAVIPGEQTTAAAISTLSTSLTSSPYTWTVNLAAGTFITLRLTDSTGAVQYSSARTIQAGSTDSCLNASASTAGIATTGAVTTTGGGSSTIAAGTSMTSMTSAMSMSSASAASSAAASSAAASSGLAASASSVSRAASSAVAAGSSAAVSAAASAAPSSGAMSNAFVGVPAIAAGILGGLALLA